MPPRPRFLRTASAGPFFDREEILAALDEELDAVGASASVVNLVGVGGIGKSRLLLELRHRAAARRHRTAQLDLQVPAMRQQADALAVLRMELGGQGVNFDRYDIAFAVLWQRMHPQLRVGADLPFSLQSEALSAVVDAASGAPVFGTAIHLLRLLDRSRSLHRRRRTIKVDDTLQRLDELSNADIVDAVTYYFAEDLRDSSTDTPYAVFVDAYEALGGENDAWLQDLIAQLDRGLIVVASRESIPWAAEWDERPQTLVVDGLPMQHRVELLRLAGVDDEVERDRIATASDGLPFYLHLAAETGAGHGSDSQEAVSSAELLRRFLQHVGKEEVRFLELLSMTRGFDFEVFRALAFRFALPNNRATWEHLVAYSFVRDAGDGMFHLHQLMATALRSRMSVDAAKEIHCELSAIWEARGSLQQAAYHASRAEVLTPDALLDYADRIRAGGGARAIGGLIADVQPTETLSSALTCVRAEQMILLGDAAAAIELTGSAGWSLATPAGERLAISAAHARRILGDTDAALDIYSEVWEHGRTDVVADAGVWCADLHMAQGRFGVTASLAGEVLARFPDVDPELRGDLARLQHLAARFAYDFATAEVMLAEAERWYVEADSVVGRCSVLTNRAELLAWTDPSAAEPAAGEAIQAHQDHGAQHELGKAYTALAIARTRLGDIPGAEEALALATDALNKAGYRSGLARAELTRAFVLARQSRLEDAALAARSAVAELVAAAVYPTLILVADELLELVGMPHPVVSAAADEARDGLEADFSESTRAAVIELLGLDPNTLLREALRSNVAAAGYYNRNVRVGEVLVRIPIHEADSMDLHLWEEYEVLAAIRGRVDRVPGLLFTSRHPPFQIQEFIDGEVLDDVAPRGAAVPVRVLDDVVAFFAGLSAVRTGLPTIRRRWPIDGDCESFGRCLSDVTEQVYQQWRERHAHLFQRLGVPEDPLQLVREGWSSLASRPFSLVHADVHRKNVILAADGRAVFIDWELALFGDPLYDLAVHIHKMGYQTAEEGAVLDRWEATMSSEFKVEWRHDISIYLRHERVKSAIVDSVRYAEILRREPWDLERSAALISKLSAKVNEARIVWGADPQLSDEQVAAALGQPHQA